MDNEFETERLLHAVGTLDELRSLLSDSEEEPGYIPRPPEVRQDLMQLHELVFNGGYVVPRDQLCKASILLEQISDAIYDITERAEMIQKVLQDLRESLPEFDDDEHEKASEEMSA